MVCSSLFCAMVRYFHMCRPFDEHEEYFYPARKLITFVYACFAMPAVWLFRMDSPDAWFFVQVFLVLFLPGAAILSFRRFFFFEMSHRLPVFIFAGVLPFLYSIAIVGCLCLQLAFTPYLYCSSCFMSPCGFIVRSGNVTWRNIPARMISRCVLLVLLCFFHYSLL